jgi:uncharacterized surface protein with fasciclin (FAS1) repeats
MKTKFKLLAFALIAFASISLTSCSKSDDSEPAVDGTITGVASRTTDLTSLVAALNRAGLASTLQGTGPFTVFAPTNAAFATFLNENGFTSLNDVPVDVLKQVLLNHVINGKKLAANLSTGYESTNATFGTTTNVYLNMYVKKTGSSIILNGTSNVTSASDIAASNGVIHIVDKVIGLPTIVTHAAANSDFSTLVSALTRADQPNFAGSNGILTKTGVAPAPFTVFAPTNAAFSSFLTENGFADLAAIPQNVLEKTLKYHVVTGNSYRASTFTNDQLIPTYSTQSVTFKTTPNRLVDVNGRNCNITITDVQCVNGVIHVLDKVLLPTF